MRLFRFGLQGLILQAITERVTGTWTVLALTACWFAGLLASIAGFDSIVPVLLAAGLPLLLLLGRMLRTMDPRGVRDLAFLDDLTGLYNRRAFTAKAMQLVKDAAPGSASLVLIDVDDLKSINDDCGHLAGDELLEEVARHLRSVARTVFRLGGDEFAILVDRASGESVTSLMRSLTPISRRFRTCGHDHVIEFSYGFASRREAESFEQVFSRADERMRQFKHRLYASGRRKDRRLNAQAAEAEMRRVIAEAEADEELHDARVVSIFSRTRRADARGDSRKARSD